MKYLIFGDTHIGREFNERKFRYLMKVINSADKVIINGDFWDDTKTTFDEFISSPWRKLFSALKIKDAVYLHGNHDLENKSDNRIYSFCRKVVDSYKIKLQNGKELKVVHGHNQSLITRLVYHFFKDRPMLLHYLTIPLDIPQKLIMSLSKHGLNVGKFINFPYRISNKKVDTVMVTGHTHAPEINLRKNYINTGFIDDNFASYLIVDNGRPTLVKEKY